MCVTDLLPAIAYSRQTDLGSQGRQKALERYVHRGLLCGRVGLMEIVPGSLDGDANAKLCLLL